MLLFRAMANSTSVPWAHSDLKGQSLHFVGLQDICMHIILSHFSAFNEHPLCANQQAGRVEASASSGDVPAPFSSTVP